MRTKLYNRPLDPAQQLQLAMPCNLAELFMEVRGNFAIGSSKPIKVYYFENNNVDDVSARVSVDSDARLSQFLGLSGSLPMLFVYPADNPPEAVPVDIPSTVGASSERSVSRSSTFSVKVKKIFGEVCVACGVSPDEGLAGLEAAHLLPIAVGKVYTLEQLASDFGMLDINDLRNGISLCKSCHQALAVGGHWYIDGEHRIQVSEALRRNEPNKCEAIDGRVVNFKVPPPQRVLDYLRKKFDEKRGKRAEDRHTGKTCSECQRYVVGKHKCAGGSWASIRTPPSEG